LQSSKGKLCAKFDDLTAGIVWLSSAVLFFLWIICSKLYVLSINYLMQDIFRFYRGFNWTYVPIYLCDPPKSRWNWKIMPLLPRHSNRGLHGLLITLSVYSWEFEMFVVIPAWE
jgi:hypothetical protein